MIRDEMREVEQLVAEYVSDVDALIDRFLVGESGHSAEPEPAFTADEVDTFEPVVMPVAERYEKPEELRWARDMSEEREAGR